MNFHPKTAIASRDKSSFASQQATHSFDVSRSGSCILIRIVGIDEIQVEFAREILDAFDRAEKFAESVDTSSTNFSC